MGTFDLRVAVGIVGVGLIACAGCSSDRASPKDQVWLVRTAPSEEPISYALAPAQGTVAIVDDCIRLDRDQGGSVVLVYPYDYQVVWRSGRPGVQDGKGRVLYAVGQHVEIGGSVLAEGTAEKIVPAEDRRHCEGPFFLVMPEPDSR